MDRKGFTFKIADYLNGSDQEMLRFHCIHLPKLLCCQGLSSFQVTFGAFVGPDTSWSSETSLLNNR
jgi:hypothetical protein